jgi:hypothetical protein
MTRFQLSSSSNYGSDYESSSSNNQLQVGSSNSRGGESLYSRISGRNESSRSVRLVTISPDGQSMHSLIKSDVNNRFIIETHRLPIQNEEKVSECRDESTRENPPVIRNQLPEDILRALEVDPPIELVCIEGESTSMSSTREDMKELPHLCLYTRKSAFLLELGYEPNNTTGFGASPTPFGISMSGCVLSLKEPFERYLEKSPKITIIRVRPAPQRHADYVTVTPKTCMAALIYNTEINEYSILLHHSDGTITTPAEWKGPEEVVGIVNAEEYVEFCFAQSLGLALFPSMSILLLKRSCEVMAHFIAIIQLLYCTRQQNQYPLFSKYFSQCFHVSLTNNSSSMRQHPLRLVSYLHQQSSSTN